MDLASQILDGILRNTSKLEKSKICGGHTIYYPTNDSHAFIATGFYVPCIFGAFNGFLTFVLFAIGFVCNSMVVAFYIKRKAARKKLGNLLLVHQAAVDLFHCLAFLLPWSCFKLLLSLKGSETILSHTQMVFSPKWDSVTVDLPTSGSIWFMCIEIFLIFPLSAGLSGFTIIITGVERFLAICFPFKHRQYATKKRFVKLLIVGWLVVIPFAALFLYTQLQNSHILLKVCFCALILIQISFTVIYAITYHKARQSVKNKMLSGQASTTHLAGQNLSQAKKELRLTFLFILMFILFILPTPLFIFGGLSLDKNDVQHEYEEYIYFIPAACCAALNPILTLKLRKDFKPSI